MEKKETDSPPVPSCREIYLLRHGELYEEGGVHRCLGRTDVPLTETGIRQVEKAALWFVDKKVKGIYTSPLSRCLHTARIVRETLQRVGQEPALTVCPELREMDAGLWENLSFGEIRERFPEEYEARGRSLGTYAPPGGESFAQAGERFGRQLERIRQEEEGNFLVVAHAGVIRGFLCGLLGCSLDEVFSVVQPYAGITVLREENGVLWAEQIGMRPAGFLDPEERRRLYRRCGTPKQVIRHMEAVAAYLDQLRERLEAADEELTAGVDWERLREAALVHDVCRTEQEHAEAGAQILRKEGFPQIAALVAAHHSGVRAETGAQLSEEELLFYADKRVLEDQVVSVEERFANSLKKCLTPEAREKHRSLYEKTKWIEEKIEHILGGSAE